MTSSFAIRIALMNKVFNLPVNYRLKDQGSQRIEAFHRVLRDEVDELLEAKKDDGTDFVALADCLGDIVVYAFSEARRWGIPMGEVLEVIMNSQDSKLVDGKPLMSSDGSKFIKGPNYVAPEEEIERLLEGYKEP